MVRSAGGYGKEAEARCFARDYDGDGKSEAYVEIGSLEEEYIQGELWFVSDEGRPQQLREDIFMRTEQEYFEQDGDIYLLMSYVDGLYERMTEELAFTGDKAFKELAIRDLSSGDSCRVVVRKAFGGGLAVACEAALLEKYTA